MTCGANDLSHSSVGHSGWVRAGPPASRYASVSSNALASCRSAVSNPSVNQV
jgi:hypothetical protein